MSFGKGLNDALIIGAVSLRSQSDNLLLNPLPDDKFQTLPNRIKFADDNFKFDENGRKLSKWVENIVGKGEIARYEQFLLFPQCFQKPLFPGASKGVIVWEGVKSLPDNNIFGLLRNLRLCRGKTVSGRLIVFKFNMAKKNVA